MQSRGGITGGLTIADALREFEARGYLGQFVVKDTGSVECVACHHAFAPSTVPVEAMRRIEGVSDPADMVYVGALECPECGARGTATIKYGPDAGAGESFVLRELVDRRPSTAMSRESEDTSLVRDTGWMLGPDG